MNEEVIARMHVSRIMNYAPKTQCFQGMNFFHLLLFSKVLFTTYGEFPISRDWKSLKKI